MYHDLVLQEEKLIDRAELFYYSMSNGDSLYSHITPAWLDYVVSVKPSRELNALYAVEFTDGDIVHY